VGEGELQPLADGGVVLDQQHSWHVAEYGRCRDQRATGVATPYTAVT
jgi:hypothetical protein